MVTINEHKDYNSKTNSTTVIEGEMIHPLNSKRTLRGKFFNILPKVWVFLDNPQYRDQYLGEQAFPLKKDYCKTPDQKTLYLNQIVQLFKRINTVPTGKKLLYYLSRVIPLNPLVEKELTVVNKFAQIIDYNNKKTHWVNTLIMPPGAGVDLYTVCNKKDKVNPDKILPLIAYPCVVSFLPDALTVMVDNNKIIYQDPTISLTHELIHSLHYITGLYNHITDMCCFEGEEDEVLIDEFLTFGKKNLLKIPFYLFQQHLNLTSKRLDYTYEIIKKCKDISLVKDYFLENFFIKKNFKNYIGLSKKDDSYKDIAYLKLISKIQCEICESQIAEELKVENRSNYLTPFLFFKKIDPTNPKHFTVKNGLSPAVSTWDVPLYPIEIDVLIEKIIHREMKKIFNEIIENKESSNTKKILNAFNNKNNICEKNAQSIKEILYSMCNINTAQTEEIVLEEAVDLKPFDIEKFKVNIPEGYKACNTDGVTANRAFSFKKDK